MEDLTGLTLRELLTLARGRLGTAASGLKTRAELLAALQGEAPHGQAPAPPPERPPEVVTRDFFRRRTE